MKDVLIKLRTENRYSQNLLAKELGISRQAYIKYETGEVEPSVEIVRKLSRIFHVSYAYLIDNGNVRYDGYANPHLFQIQPQPVVQCAEASPSYEPEIKEIPVASLLTKKFFSLSPDEQHLVENLLDTIFKLKIEQKHQKLKRTPGGLDGLWMSDDFDEPLEDFKEYM